jgi:ankyrin repeat protein
MNYDKEQSRIVELALTAEQSLKGIDVNRQNDAGETILMIPCYHNDIEVVKSLLSTGIQTSDKSSIDIDRQDNKGRTALIISSLRGHDRIVQLLLTVEPHPSHERPLGVPVTLSKPFIDVNKQDTFGRTALIVASGSEHDKVVQLLLAVEQGQGRES